MKRWGYAITAFYAVVLLVLLIPGGALLVFANGKTLLELDAKTLQGVPRFYLEYYQSWIPWIYAAILVAGQALLLFLSVDTSWRHAKPRQHIAVTVTLASFFTAVLALCALFSIEVAIYGDKAPPLWKGQEILFAWTAVGVWIGLWIFWGGIFYHYYRDSSNIVSVLVAWLLKGSVLELLIAIPAHVIARQRGDCSAPAFTSFGIVTGLAIMLLSFGPGVLALYKKRLDAYSKSRVSA